MGAMCCRPRARRLVQVFPAGRGSVRRSLLFLDKKYQKPRAVPGLGRRNFREDDAETAGYNPRYYPRGFPAKKNALRSNSFLFYRYGPAPLPGASLPRPGGN